MRTPTSSFCFCFCILLVAVPLAARAADAPSADGDWPQLLGPARNGLAKSPKLLDVWPKEGPKLAWQADGLPYAPVCGVGSPIVAGNKVYTYAHTVEPVKGIKPFAKLIETLGYSPDIPADLNKKIDEAQFGQKRGALKSDEEIAAFTREFLATLDPDQAKKFADVIAVRMKLGGGSFDWATVAKFAESKDKEIESREEFMNMFVEWFHHTIYHGPMAAILSNFSDKLYKDQKFVDMIFCLDLATGKELWRKSMPGVKKSFGVEFGCSATPTIYKDHVYYRGSGGLYCLDANKQGEVVWQVKGEPGNNSPVAADGVIYCIVDNLKAFDAATGKQLWSEPKIIGDCETPAVWTHQGKNYILCQCAAPRYYYPFFCLDAATGKEQWTIPSGTSLFREYTACTVIGDTLYARTGGGCVALALALEKPSTIWLTKDCGDQGGAPVIYQHHVYLCGQSYGSNVIVVLDEKTGKVTFNSKGERAGRCATPLIADGKLFFMGFGGYRIGHLIATKTTPDKCEDIGILDKVDCAVCSSPAFANGKLLIRLSRGIACYDLQEHGPYLSDVVAKKDALIFNFKQTGGLAAKAGASDILVTDASGSARPAKFKIDGESLVVDTSDAAVPFDLTYAVGGSLTGKDGASIPAFSWKSPRLSIKKCLEHTVVLGSDPLLDSEKMWLAPATYSLTGAKVTAVEAVEKGLRLTTDKEWKQGDVVTLSCACFPVESGDTRRVTLTFAVPATQPAAAKFVKLDEKTSGTWKGVYGTDGAIVIGDSTAGARYVTVTPQNKTDHSWLATTDSPRALQKTSGSDRNVSCWYSASFLDLELAFTDGQEHQVALYCLDWDTNSRAMTVEVRNTDSGPVLDSQTVKEFKDGKYLVWNLKGNVTLHLINTGSPNALLEGLFFDAVKTGK